MLHSRYFIVDKCYSVLFFSFKNPLVSRCCYYIMIILKCNYHIVIVIILITNIILITIIIIIISILSLTLQFRTGV